MKTAMISAMLALSVLAGMSTANARTYSDTVWDQLDRENRGGQGN
jgi:hypothetical protein